MSQYTTVENGRIGEGRFGTVWKVRRRQDQKILARKTINIGGKVDSQMEARREYDIVCGLKHVNVAGFLDLEFFPNEQDAKEVMLYMDYYQHHSLHDLIVERKKQNNHLSEEYIWTVMYQLSSALAYCHYSTYAIASDSESPSKTHRNKTVLHRDIKPANVFLASTSETVLDAVKLGDFGVGAIIEDKNKSTYVGTREYLPPEISRNNDYNRWTPKCDIFSLGCTIIELCDLERPFKFHVENTEDAKHSLKNPRYSADLNCCLKACISRNPDQRPDAHALLSETEKHMKGNANYQTALNNHILLTGASEGKFETVLSQIEQGTSIDATAGTDGETALHKAIRYGNPALVKFLVEGGASLSKKNKEGQTALHIAVACVAGDHGEAIVGMLLEYGSSLNAYDGYMRAPLHTAAASNQIGNINKIHAHGADLELRTGDSGQSRAVHIAAENGHLSVIEALESLNADINATTSGGENALHIAAENGHLDLLRFLLSRHMKPDTIFSGACLTALHQAARNGHDELTLVLLQSGASARAKTTDRETPLHFAATAGHDRAIHVLVRGTPISTSQSISLRGLPTIPSKRLAELEAKTKKGKTALHLAIENKRLSTVELLLSLGSDFSAKTADCDTPLHQAVLENSQEMVSALLRNGANVSAPGLQKATPLHYAAYKGYVDMVNYLVQNEISRAELEERTYSGESILHIAVLSGHIPLATQLLRDLGFSANLRDEKGETALHYAAQRGNYDMLDLLVDFSDVSLRSNNRQTARYMAEREGHTRCMERLLKCERTQ